MPVGSSKAPGESVKPFGLGHLFAVLLGPYLAVFSFVQTPSVADEVVGEQLSVAVSGVGAQQVAHVFGGEFHGSVLLFAQFSFIERPR